MSWQAYVDSNLVGTGKVAKAAIHGHDGGVWATSAGFSVSPTEVSAIVGAFKDASGIRASGLRAGGVKYITLRADDRTIQGKSGTSGIVCVKSKQAVLIGTYNEGTQPGECSVVVEKLADYLISNGY